MPGKKVVLVGRKKTNLHINSGEHNYLEQELTKNLGDSDFRVRGISDWF